MAGPVTSHFQVLIAGLLNQITVVGSRFKINKGCGSSQAEFLDKGCCKSRKCVQVPGKTEKTGDFC